MSFQLALDRREIQIINPESQQPFFSVPIYPTIPGLPEAIRTSHQLLLSVLPEAAAWIMEDFHSDVWSKKDRQWLETTYLAPIESGQASLFGETGRIALFPPSVNGYYFACVKVEDCGLYYVPNRDGIERGKITSLTFVGPVAKALLYSDQSFRYNHENDSYRGGCHAFLPFGAANLAQAIVLRDIATAFQNALLVKAGPL